MDEIFYTGRAFLSLMNGDGGGGGGGGGIWIAHNLLVNGWRSPYIKQVPIYYNILTFKI